MQVAQVSQLGETLEKARLEVNHLAPLEVDEICLFQSDLRPGGPVYASLARGLLERS